MRSFTSLALLPLLLAGAMPAIAQQAPGELLFISPMGEPFRGTLAAPPEMAWFDQVDANHDGTLTDAEMIADAGRFFKTLDVDGSGEIDPIEIERYETDIAPEVRSGEISVQQSQDDTAGDLAGGPSGMERYQTRRGAVMFSYFGFPEPVMAADANFNRGVTLREFQLAAVQRLGMLDKNNDGMLQRTELPPPPRRKAKKGRP
jgi:hypothetical protein